MKIRWLQPLLLNFIPRIAAGFSCVMGHTTELTIIGPPNVSNKQQFFSWPQGVIYCCWHSRFFYYSFFGRGQRVITMISASKDGELIVRTIAQMRLYAVRGSSSKLGHEALHELEILLRENNRVLMIPDGPRGPNEHLKPGVIRLAQLTGRPILPMTFSSTHGIFFSSWDRFFLPLPGGKGVMVLGEPVYVPATLTQDEFEETRIHVENVMKRIRCQADQLCGRNPEKEAIHIGRKRNKSKIN